MKLIKSMSSLVVLGFTVAAYATPVKLSVESLRSESVNGIHRYTILPQDNGNLEIVTDPNVCGNPGPCTQMAVSREVVNPVVLKDSRPTDGALYLQLNKQLVLEVGSGYNREHHVAFVLVESKENGQKKNYVMTPEVKLTYAR